MVRWRSVLRVFCASARVAVGLLSFFFDFVLYRCSVERRGARMGASLAWLASRVFLKSLLDVVSFFFSSRKTKENQLSTTVAVALAQYLQNAKKGRRAKTLKKLSTAVEKWIVTALCMTR